MKNLNTLQIKTQEKTSSQPQEKTSTATFPFSTSDLLHQQNLLCQHAGISSGAFHRITAYLMKRVNFTFITKDHLSPQIALGETVGLTDETVAEKVKCKPSTVSTYRNAVKGKLLTFERAKSTSGHARCGVWIYYFHSFIELGLERKGKPIVVKVMGNVISPHFTQVDEEEIHDEIEALKRSLEDDQDSNNSQQTLELIPVNTGISEAEKEASNVDDDCIPEEKSHPRYLQSQSIYLNNSLIELEVYSMTNAKSEEMAKELFKNVWQPNRKRLEKPILSKEHHEKGIDEVIKYALEHKLCSVGQLYERLEAMLGDDRNKRMITPQGFITAVDGKSFIENYLPHPEKVATGKKQKKLIAKTRGLVNGGLRE